MMDVDNFKSYNDRFGHPAGDACLRRIAQTILELQHRSTDLLARYGGEEFSYLLPGAGQEDAARIAETIRERIENMHAGFLEKDRETPDAHPMSISIGCAALTPTLDLKPELLLASSDAALYRAKRNGRNRVEVGDAASAAGDPRRTT
jgi:two-component system, sensor histidine kinase LadS